MTVRTCGWCTLPISGAKNRRAIYCSGRCRRAAHRWQRAGRPRIDLEQRVLASTGGRMSPPVLASAAPSMSVAAGAEARRSLSVDEVVAILAQHGLHEVPEHGALFSERAA